MDDSNHDILKQLNESDRWFKAVKVAEVWAKENTDTSVVESLEGDTAAKSGDIICRGPKGDKWVQPPEKFHAKYRSVDVPIDSDGFQKYVPIPEKSQVMAAKVKQPFKVSTQHGDLNGKANDYLLKSIDDKDVEFPDSVWVVAETIFATTYKPV